MATKRVRTSLSTRLLPGAVISTLPEYLKYVQDVCSNFPYPLFRGQSQEDWRLVPKIARLTVRDDTDLVDAEKTMLQEFRMRAVPHLEYQPRTPWEWLAIAQHHGMPTRLLDWTTNPLAALWFAIEKPPESEARAAVWIFHVFTSDHVADPEAESPFTVDVTRVFRPTHLTRRIVAQDGWFTVHKYVGKSKRFIPLETNARYKNRVRYVAIPLTAFPRLRNELDRCGLNAASLFPDLPGVSEYVQWKVSPLLDEE